MRRSTVGRGHQADFTPNLLIAHLEKIAPPAVLLREPSPPFGKHEQPVDVKEAEVCTVVQHPLTATGTAVWCTGMCQVPPRVDNSIWCCELSLLLRGWSPDFLPC